MLGWDDVFKKILSDLVTQDEVIVAGKSHSVGSARATLELLNYQFTLTDPRDRILWNDVRKFNLFGAIARFFWMLSGNDRLKDIEFYEPKVSGFSDDQLTVPGSDYGKRLFMPEPGLDQIDAAVSRIKNETGTRRAFAIIYRPEDAVRESKDIPCAIGIGFHPRGGVLHVTTLMRSNAAWGLLPYNVFEFTLLGELVSVLAGMPVGNYTHFALSMHLYKGAAGRGDEVESAQQAISRPPKDLPPLMSPMPAITFDELRKILQWEADVRYDSKGINATNYRDYVQRCRGSFHQYWADLCLPLLAFVLFTNKRVAAGLDVIEQVADPIRSALLQHPLINGLNIPGLEEDRTLLESRLRLLDYANGQAIPEPRRETLWKNYTQRYTDEYQTAGGRERRSPFQVQDWMNLDHELQRLDEEVKRAAKSPGLFDSK